MNPADKHDALRDILIEYGNPEFGDAIIDAICHLFDYPDTIDVTPEEE